MGRRYGGPFNPAIVALAITAIFGQAVDGEAGRLHLPAVPLHAYIGFILFNQLNGIIEAHLLLVSVSVTMVAGAYALHRWIEQPLVTRD